MTKNTTLLNREIIFFLFFFVLIGISFKFFFGLYSPIVIIQSKSMEPYYHIGDIVFIQKPNLNFLHCNTVVVYYSYGNHSTIPIIHRTLYFVYKGEVMWPYGPIAEHSGLITKGDNNISNQKLDQQSIICAVPIKKEWLIGIEVFSIPNFFKLIIHF